jgi:hypothetical protein
MTEITDTERLEWCIKFGGVPFPFGDGTYFMTHNDGVRNPNGRLYVSSFRN